MQTFSPEAAVKGRYMDVLFRFLQLTQLSVVVSHSLFIKMNCSLKKKSLKEEAM